MALDKARNNLENKFYDLCKKVVVEEGLNLYDMDYKAPQALLRVYIYNDETDSADLQDCVRVDKALTPYLDEADWIPDQLLLEVSSPGVYRFLRNKEHFIRALNKRVKVKLCVKLNEDIKNLLPKSIRNQSSFKGPLRTVDDNGIELEVRNVIIRILFDQIKEANVDPDLNDIK